MFIELRNTRIRGMDDDGTGGLLRNHHVNLSELGDWRGPFDGEFLFVGLNVFNFVECFGGQVTLTAMGANANRDVLNHQKTGAMAIYPGGLPGSDTFFSAIITNHLITP